MAPQDLLKSVRAVPLVAAGRHGDNPAVIPVVIKKYDVVFHLKNFRKSLETSALLCQ